jgi:sporulation protein YlmC with PRC-barrel domain
MPRAGISDPMKIDAMALRGGVRTSQVVGMSVVNNTNETVGTIDDLIVMPGEAVPYAVLSIGAYMGVPEHYVVVPYSMLTSRDNKSMRLPNATKDSLKAMPMFRYPA